jgi:hypothetical protein
MRVSRRAFGLGLAGAAVALAADGNPAVTERRVYRRGSLLPSRDLLKRAGIYLVSIRRTPNGAEYLFQFDSLAARAKAWDRFNTDSDWCAMRDAGSVRLAELEIYPGGKIFEMSL